MIPIPIKIEITKGTPYSGINKTSLVPAAWGKIPVKDQDETPMEAFILSEKPIKALESVFGATLGYYRVKEEKDDLPWFIFICRAAKELTLPDDVYQAQLLKIHRFLEKHFILVSYGNEEAADVILKYCKIGV